MIEHTGSLGYELEFECSHSIGPEKKNQKRKRQYVMQEDARARL